MKAPKREFPYEEFGNFLVKWRREKYRSALALFKEAKFSFSYKAYADFERGAVLPSTKVLLELSQYFKKDLREAVLLWAEVQMPTEEMKQVFRVAKTPPAEAGRRRATDRKVEEAPPTFENTWVFGPKERQALLKTPWLWDVFAVLSVNHPQEVSYAEIPREKKITSKQLTEKHLKSWIQDGLILVSQHGLKLRYPFIHIPKSADWNNIGVNNISRASEQLLKRNTRELMDREGAYRALLDRKFTRAQAQRWVQELKRLEARFMAEAEGAAGEPETFHTLLALFGPERYKG